MNRLFCSILAACMALFAFSVPSAMAADVDDRVESVLSGMTLYEKVCQMMVVYQYRLPVVGGSGYVSATETGTPLKKSLDKYPVGGILYDASSMKNHDQLRNLVSTAQGYAKYPMIISIDEEGGRVARIGNTLGYAIGAVTKLNPMLDYESQGEVVAEANANIIAQNIAWHGFNLDYAPVADVHSNPKNPVINSRAYSTDFDTAATLVPAAVRGFHSGGVACTLKHFPGHGDTSSDSHAGSSYTYKTINEIRNNELKPFQGGINEGADSVMIAHIIVEELGVPCLFSHEIITDILRDEMGFDGVVISDGLGMKAMTDVYSTEEICLNSIKAGNDMFCCFSDVDTAINCIVDAVERGEITESRIDESVRRILTLKFDRGIMS